MANKRVAFIVRVWTETERDIAADPVWRGVVELVGSKQVRYFHSFDQIPAIIQTFMADPGQTTADEEKNM